MQTAPNARLQVTEHNEYVSRAAYDVSCNRALAQAAGFQGKEMAATNPPQQLHMLWPEERLASPPTVKVPPGYRLRVYEPSDLAPYLKLMSTAGLGEWNTERLEAVVVKVLPNGFFVIEHSASDELVAGAMAMHNPRPLHPHGGELSWVAASPAHAGKGLGTAVCAAVVARLLRAGYERIYLCTDDPRLPALKVYLKLGFIPFLLAPDMPGRWRAVCEKLGRPFTPEKWPA